MKTLADNFTSIDPKLLDEWFVDMMTKYRNSNLGWHLKSVYMELTGESVMDNSLMLYYNNKRGEKNENVV